MRIAIIDYGMGNIRSVETTLNHCGVSEVLITSNYEDIKSSDKIILPGVGSFAEAMRTLNEKKIIPFLKEMAQIQKKPLLGICLGMQLIGDSSNEDGQNDGLKLINSLVRKFPTNSLKIPHVGFNQVKINNNSKLFYGFENMYPDFYFTHSYRMQSSPNLYESTCNYGEEFVAAFEIGNIAGVQFHPELSQSNGLKLLKNFINLF
jgi:imidazole glycerol-phosphate synthase subunit HisH